MADRVFLHIGLPKTGTTYLQDALWANKAALAERGLLVPGSTRRRHLLASLDVREDPKLARRRGNVRAPWQELVDQANAWADDALISHEFFGPAAPHQVRRVVDSFPDTQVDVIVTCRAMVDLGISRWQEWVKNGGRADIDSYPRSEDYDPSDAWGWGSFDLGDVLGRWGSVVPHQQVHVLPMAAGRSDPSELWVRFLSVLGVEPEGLEIPASAVNRTLGIVETELLRRVNRHLKEFRSAADRGNWIRGHLADPRILGSSRERFRPGEEVLSELRQRGARAVRMLRDEGYDLVGSLDLLEPSDVGDLRHPSEVTDEEMLASATRAIAVLLEDVRRLTRERDELNRELRGRRVTVRGLLRRLHSRV